MISYIDIAFFAMAVIMIIAGVKKGFLVSLLSMAKFIIILPLSYFLSDFVKPYIPAEILGEAPEAVIEIIAFLICFLVLLVVGTILLSLLKKLQKDKDLPLHNTNAVLGGAFGFVKAFILVCVFSAIIGAAEPYIPKDSAFIEMVHSSYAIDLINDINPFN
ncbi:MAG: CvpA family protein [Eubacterium sp.]|nr:CvpA family protein [Eubacterium sp.]